MARARDARVPACAQADAERAPQAPHADWSSLGDTLSRFGLAPAPADEEGFSSPSGFLASEWPKSRPGARRSRTFCFTSLASGNLPSAFRDHTSTPST
eukprot:CAMPEP_0171158988 /NCGR_PEP_ID=MMETSP0790-20130122/2801_1 /TAXON_ID=2925 /ORGANISM="Alexandrium catenella, Strain OF101" /LENGTH=97 /DNA_ID=CAMNT_0011623459 /DNA_START=12 /DNA_END=305 /DNA_ORIENTATION=-